MDWIQGALEARCDRMTACDHNFNNWWMTMGSDVVTHSCSKCGHSEIDEVRTKRLVERRAFNGWERIESAPKEETVPFLVLTHEYVGEHPVVIQVSRYEGRLYPDALGPAVDGDDAVSDATHWRPLPELPQ